MVYTRARLLAATAAVMILAVLPPARAASDCAEAPSPAGDWASFGLDLHNTRNQVKETTIGADNVASLAPVWDFSVAEAGGVGTIESNPMVANGCVFVGTQGGSVFALDADNGDIVWSESLGATVTTLSVANNKVFAAVSRPDAPALVALDQQTGATLWDTTLTTMGGSDVTGSPVAFQDLVAVGTSCIGAEGSSGAARLTCRGSFPILRQSDGVIIAQAYGIPDEDFEDGYAGGAMWSAPAIDLEDGYAYMGAGNPFSAREHPRSNALLKIDIDRDRATFGTVVDSYKATGEQYMPLLGTYKPACEASDSNVAACEFPDLDMAMAPTIFHDGRGRKLVGDGQSSGIYHSVYADTMEFVWTTVTGPPFAAARSGGAAYDGSTIYTAGGAPGQLWALEKDRGNPNWIAPTFGPSLFTTVAHANGVIYMTAGGGFGGNAGASLIAYDAETGDVLLARPFAPDIQDVAIANQAGGVTVAQNTIFAPVNSVGSGGHIVAYKLP